MVATKKPTSPAESSSISTGLGVEDAHGLDVEDLVVPHEADLHAFAHAAVNDSRQYDHPAVRVEPRVEK